MLIIIILSPMDKIQLFQLISIIAALLYLIVSTLGFLSTFIVLFVFLNICHLVVKRWTMVRQRGFIQYCNPKLQALLVNRSFLDVFRDLVYFPYITKIIGIFLHVVATKPHPSHMQEALKELPKEVAEAVNKKGLLSLAPSTFESLILPAHSRQIMPANYGIIDQKWDNADVYNNSVAKVHQETFEKRVVHFLDGKLGWPAAFTLLAITSIGIYKMQRRQFASMMTKNITFYCMLLAAISILVKIRKNMRKNPQSKAIQGHKEE